tara:strand:- start:9 stop:374 length:366 start_codon:yes stop_codon:yes gene_type:complete
MAHYAELNSENVVTRVLVVNNDVITDSEGNESEEMGKLFLQGIYKTDNNFIQTSYNGNFRKNYAGIGHTYDETRDAFIPPQPYPSWTLNETSCLWDAPVAHPDDGNMYQWNEDTTSWDEIS